MPTHKLTNTNKLFNFDDIANGRGLVDYWLFITRDTAAALQYNIDTTALRPGSGSGEANFVATAFNSAQTFTFFSGAFTLPRVIDGNTLFTFNVNATGGAGDDITFVIKFYHYDGTTSTQIGTTWTSPSWSITEGGNEERTFTGSVVLPRTKYRIGDQIKMEFIMTPGGGDTIANCAVGVDPTDSDDYFKLHIPFRLGD